MSFATEVVKDGRGVVHRLDISLDGFSSIAYRYGDVSGLLDGTNQYDDRIKAIGALSRGLGLDHIFQAGQVSIVFANDDEGADWLVDRTNATDVKKARCRLYVGVYDPAAGFEASAVWKQLGEFIFDELPQRNDSVVTALLSDDTLGHLLHPVTSPTPRDWFLADSSSATNPLRQGSYFNFSEGLEHRPVQLAWGNGSVPAYILGRALGLNRTLDGCAPAIVCATTSTATVAADDITTVWMKITGLGWCVIPSTNAAGLVWQPRKSETIAKGGKNWKILWLEIFPVPFVQAAVDAAAATLGYSRVGTVDIEAANFGVIEEIRVFGSPLSARTNQTPELSGVDVVEDLVSYYSGSSSAAVDTASFDRVRAVRTYVVGARGIINAPGDIRPLRDHITAIAASFDFYVFTRWDGSIGVTCRNIDYASQTETLISVEENDLDDVTEEQPSREQIGAPTNRLFVSGFIPEPFSPSPEPNTGPFDDPSGSITTWGRIHERTVSAEWVDPVFAQMNPWDYRNIERDGRALLSFSMPLEGLRVELGDYIQVTWTRGLGDPYDGTIFWVIDSRYVPDPERLRVELKVLYAGDLRTDAPYLLDNETLHILATGSGLRTATVEDTNDTVTFSSGDLSADGVQAGDLLILKDSTEATDGFTRNRTLLIETVLGATSLRVDSADLDFDAASPLAVSGWEIRVGVANRNSLAGANYLDGVDIYGAVADADTGGVYSTAAAAAKLLEG